MLSNTVIESEMPKLSAAFDRKQIVWLIRLRWCAFVGLSLVIGVAQLLLGIEFSFAYAWGLTVLFALSNLSFKFLTANRASLNKSWVAWILIFDTFLLTGILGVTGGAANPFSLIYLALVSIAAFLLGTGWTWIMVGLSSICFALLFKFHISVPALSMHHGDGSSAFTVHLFGMLFAFVSVSTLLGYFLSLMSYMLTSQRDEIIELNKKSADRERLASLVTLSAGAAHELATPLGTIAVAASELRRYLTQTTQDTDVAEDIDLIIRQVRRCRNIIDSMGESSGELKGEPPVAVRLSKIVEEVRKDLSDRNLGQIEVNVESDATLSVPIRALVTGVVTLVKNALEACEDRGQVKLSALAEEGQVTFEIADSGKGIPSSLVSRIGEPFFTTKEPGKGMGLGVFLTKVLAQRLNGKLEIDSREGTGTIVKLSLPL